MPTRVRHAPTRPGDEQPTAAAGSGGAEIWLTMDVPPEPELTDDDSEDEYYFATTLTRLTLTTTWLRLTLTRQTPARMVAETPAGTPNLTWRPWTATAPEFCVFWPDLCVACPCLCCNLCCNSGLTAGDQCSYVLFCIIALPLPPPPLASSSHLSAAPGHLQGIPCAFSRPRLHLQRPCNRARGRPIFRVGRPLSRGRFCCTAAPKRLP